MTNRLYVGNLAFNTDTEALQSAFSRCGVVDDIKIVLDRETGRSRGFAFVSMADADGARNAISQLDGTVIDGRALRVSEAQERQSGGGGGGGSFRGGARRSF